MSSDEADSKNIEEETKNNGAAEDEKDSSDEKSNNKISNKKKAVDPPKIKQPAKKRMKTEQVEKESKKDDKKDKKVKEVKDEKEEELEDENENIDESKKDIPLLDQPLEIQGSRRRKEVQRFIPIVTEEENKEVQIPEGKGKALGEIERIDFNIQRAKIEDLKILHRFCFGRQCKAVVLKKNIKRFNGFDFEEASDEYEKRKTIAAKNKKLTLAHLRNIANIIDLDRSLVHTGTRDDLLERILSYLVCPVDLGKKLPGGGRSKRKGVSAMNYDEGDESFASRRKNRGKKKNEESEDDAEKPEEEEVEEKEDKIKKSERKQSKTQNSAETKSEPEKDEEEEEEKEDEVEDKVEEKKAKKGTKKGKKATETADKKAPPKKRNAVKKAIDKAESEEDEDEPLSKKTKTPPTDEEIKNYVKSLLDGANLELITMKKVCHDVYAHYPDFDLGHKKEFIKTTVKSLISS